MTATDFGERLASLRKERGLTQLALAEMVGVHVSQVHRYESGAALPAFGVLKALALALRVSADVLLFEDARRGPGADFKLQFEALSRFTAAEKKVVKALLDGLILKHQAKPAKGPIVADADPASQRHRPRNSTSLPKTTK